MPTLEDARRLARDFKRTYPSALSERLAWWSNDLGIGRVRLLRLMGLKSPEVFVLRHRTWAEIARIHADRASRIEDTLCELLARYSYDWRALAEDIRRDGAPGGEEESSSPRKNSLARKVAKGGPDSLDALWDFLSLP